MTCRIVTLIFALVIGTAPLAADCQPPVNVPRIGVLRIGAPPDPYVGALHQGLRELGWVEGRTIASEYRWAAGRLKRLPELAAELVSLRVDVIVAGGGVAAVQAARRATRTIPIVTPGIADPVKSGLVASVRHPGGNLTGLAFPTTELDTKRLRLLKEAVPRISRVAVLWNPPHPVHGFALQNIAAVARSLGVQPLEVWAPEHLAIAFSATSRGYAEAVLVVASPMPLGPAGGVGPPGADRG